MKKLGSHISFKAPNYLKGALDESIKNGANTMMIYLGAPQNAKRVDVSKYKLEEYKASEKQIPFEDIVVHAPYIVNPASMDKYEFAIDFLIKEIERMNYFGAKYLVLHPGAHTKWSREESIQRLVDSLKIVLSKTEKVMIVLETMAGKGTEIGTSFEELKEIIDKVDSSRLGICLDTCHIWEGGYDVQDFKSVTDVIDKLNLKEKIKVLHINDSKNPISSHKDRHENIGKGHIGFKALNEFVNGKYFENVIKVLETPWVDGVPIYKEEIKLFSI